MLDWTGSWGVLSPGRSLGLFVMFPGPFLNESCLGGRSVAAPRGARAMSDNVYLAYIYQSELHMNARVGSVPGEREIHASVSVVGTEIHLLLPIKPLQNKTRLTFRDINRKEKMMHQAFCGFPPPLESEFVPDFPIRSDGKGSRSHYAIIPNTVE